MYWWCLKGPFNIITNKKYKIFSGSGQRMQLEKKKTTTKHGLTRWLVQGQQQGSRASGGGEFWSQQVWDLLTTVENRLCLAHLLKQGQQNPHTAHHVDNVLQRIWTSYLSADLNKRMETRKTWKCFVARCCAKVQLQLTSLTACYII